MVSARGGKFVQLAVSGAFHSGLMTEAARGLQPDLAGINWQEPVVPILSNVTAQPLSAAEMSDELYRQIFSPVLWEDILLYLEKEQINTFIEVGPGKVLSGLVKRTIKTPGITIISCENAASIKKALEILREV